MLKRRFVDDVIVQADYMSGDRNTIASALRVNDRLGVLLLAGKGHAQTGAELDTFYKAAANVNRIELLTIDLPNRSSAETAKTKVRDAYKEIDNWCRNVKDKRANPAPAWVRSRVEGGVRLHPATYGTGEIAGKFDGNANETRKKLQQYWRLPDNSLGTGLRTAVKNWLTSKGFRDNRAYVFLFTKEGDRRAEKAHHFTSILTWRILQERIEKETSVIPVAAGDDIGLRTNPRMVKFWDETEWKKIFEGRSMDPRSAQLGMWCFLAENFKGVSIIGMRSGMIEVPALLGIRTLYLEEKHNSQAARMAKWLNGTVPGFERQVVNTPPGIKQQVYWRGESLKAPRSSDVNAHAVQQGGHVRNLVMGFESKTGDTQYKGTQYDPSKPLTGRSLAAKQPGTLSVDVNDKGKTRSGATGARVLATAVFGRRGLATVIPAEKFMLQSSEFKSILEWVAKTPKPTGAVDAVHGYIDGRLQKKDEAVELASAAKNIKNWSEYFSSPEYIAQIGADKPLVLSD